MKRMATNEREILEMALIGYQQQLSKIEGRISDIKWRMSTSAQEVTGIIAKRVLEKAIAHASTVSTAKNVVIGPQNKSGKHQWYTRTLPKGLHIAPKRRAVSPEARKRMARAQRLRWQRYHKAHKAVA